MAEQSVGRGLQVGLIETGWVTRAAFWTGQGGTGGRLSCVAARHWDGMASEQQKLYCAGGEEKTSAVAQWPRAQDTCPCLFQQPGATALCTFLLLSATT